MRSMKPWLLACAVISVAQPAPAPAQAPAFTIVQLEYGGGGDWYANPSGLPNLLAYIREQVGVPVADVPVSMKLTDPRIWSYPYLYLTGHGNIEFTEEEVRILRQYLTSGGFLHADDNYGLDESFRREIARVFPDAELVELPPDHAVYHAHFELTEGLPKVHEHDAEPAQGFGIFHEGRLVVYYSYESDLGNGWEDEDVYGNSPEIRERALQMGANLFLYALAQGVR